MSIIIDCPIWGVGNEATLYSIWMGAGGKPRITHEDRIISARAGGAFRLTQAANYLVSEQQLLSSGAKARLTTWLVDQRRHGIREPVITWEIADSFRQTDDRRALSVAERAERLLRFLVDQTKIAGETVVVDNFSKEALAWSESTDMNEIFYLLKYLSDRGFIEDYDHFGAKEALCLATVTVVRLRVHRRTHYQSR